MSGQTTGAQDVPERPVDESDDLKERTASTRSGGLDNVCMEPGDRKTDNVELLVIEAELVADGHEPDNPAKPRTEGVGERFRDRLAERDGLVPAWTRPWEHDDGGNE